MRNYKHYVLGALTVAASLGFAACSSDNDVIKPGADVNNVYMQLSLEGTTTTRSDQTGATTDNGYDFESTVKTGTLFLYNADGSVAFRKQITESDWIQNNGAITSNPIPVSVNNVKENTPYTVYFLANSYGFSNPVSDTHSASSLYVGPFANKNAFVMFNQNDKSHDGAQYKVTFTAANKDKSTPAKVVNGKGVVDDAIKIERVVSRIDAPKATVTAISEASNISESQKDALEKVESLEYLGYAISNIAQKTNVMQHWNNKLLETPELTEAQYYNNYSDFGTTIKRGGVDFNTTPDSTYVFENITANTSNLYTRMYFKFKVNLKNDGSADCTDGTFYRYDHKIYTSLEAIEKSIGGTNPFGETVDNLKNNTLRIVDGKITAGEEEIASFRQTYNIEVFEGGVCYYNTPINDEKTEPGYYSILRNTIYKLNVKNIYNVGSDVPNGKPEDLKPNYYIQVAVTVTPWILRTYDVELQ